MFSLRDPWSVLTDISFTSPKQSQISMFAGLRPYQTLLLLPPPLDHSLSQKKSLWDSVLPEEASPLLKKFVEAVKPSKSFSMIQLETEIPLSQLYLLAAHLAFWNYGRIINQLTKTNVYLMNPQYRSLKSTDPIIRYLSRDFSNTFAGFRFEDVLERFSDPKTLKDHLDALVPTLQRDFVDVVSWLLQRLIIVQLHTYIYCTINLNKAASEDKLEPITEKEIALIEDKGYDITDSTFEEFKRYLKTISNT